MKRMIFIAILACVVTLSACAESHESSSVIEPLSVNLSDYEAQGVFKSLEFLGSADSPIKLERIEMPDFGTESLDCYSEGELGGYEIMGVDLKEPSEGIISVYTIYESCAYFVVSYDWLHTYSHSVRVFSLNLDSGEFDTIYDYTDNQNGLLVSDIYVNDDGVYLINKVEGENDDFDIIRLTDSAKAEKVITVTSALGFCRQSDSLSWYSKDENSDIVISSYDGSQVQTLPDTYYRFRNSRPVQSEKYSYGAFRDESGKIYIKSTNGNRTIYTDYDFIDLLYADKDGAYWLEWEEPNDYGDPYVYFFSFAEDKLNVLSVANMGVRYSFACPDGKMFVHLIEDKMNADVGDSYEQIYYIDFENLKAYNLTENKIGWTDSAMRVEYGRVQTAQDYMYFYSRYNPDEDSFENMDYQYLYWHKL